MRNNETVVMAALVGMALQALVENNEAQDDQLMELYGGGIGIAEAVADAARYIVANAPEELGLGEGTDMYITADEAAERIFNGEPVDRPGLFYVWGDEGEDTDSEDNENDAPFGC